MRTINGILNAVVSAPPPGVEYIEGWATAQGGAGYIYNLFSAKAPASKQIIEGLAYTPAGALYVTTDTPSNPRFINGLAIRDDGAVYVRESGSAAQYVNGWPLTASGAALIAGDIQFSNLAAWYRYGLGITVTGAGVSNWEDKSGNGRNLLQGTDTNRPALQADGSILFDGVDNFLKTADFTINQPITLYILFKQVTHTTLDRILGASAALQQIAASPDLRLNAGAAAATNSNLAVGTYGAVCAVFNGASSLLQVNLTAPTTGNAGANFTERLTMGANSDGSAQWSNIQVKEAIAYNVAHSASQISQTVNYLNSL